jgi:hypothetical protein
MINEPDLFRLPYRGGRVVSVHDAIRNRAYCIQYFMVALPLCLLLVLSTVGSRLNCGDSFFIAQKRADLKT